MGKRVSQVKLQPVLQTAPFSVADVIALQALASGVADSEAQKRALKWIIYQACDFNGITYRESDRDTAFGEGKKFVAHQINAVLTSNHREMKE